MSYRGLSKSGRDQFHVAFAKLQHQGVWGLVPGLVRQQPVEIDPYLVGQAVRFVMHSCESRDVYGRLLIWNEYRVFLAESDYQSLLPLEGRLLAGLDTVIRSTLAELEAETVGDVVVRVLVNDESEAPPGVGEIAVAFVDNASLRPETRGEPTVRVARTSFAAVSHEGTRRVAEPAVAGSLRLSWEGHEACIAPRRKVKVGRPHAEPPENFVPLTGASQRINSYQLTIENGSPGVVITRPVRANPVQVGGRLIQAGGKLSVAEFPLRISLSNDDLILGLERLGEG